MYRLALLSFLLLTQNSEAWKPVTSLSGSYFYETKPIKIESSEWRITWKLDTGNRATIKIVVREIDTRKELAVIAASEGKREMIFYEKPQRPIALMIYGSEPWDVSVDERPHP